MIILKIKNHKTATALYNKIDRLPKGRWGSLGGQEVVTEEEYNSPEGDYIVAFKKLPSEILEWARTHKQIDVSEFNELIEGPLAPTYRDISDLY